MLESPIIGGFHFGWEMIHRSREWGPLPDPRVVCFFWRFFEHMTREERGRVNVLDVGCGVGGNSVPLAAGGFIVEGIDASPSAIARARERRPAALAHLLDYQQCDVTAIPAPASAYDVVIDVRCLECLTDEACASALAEIHRVMKPGGMLLSMSASAGCADPLNPMPPLRKMSAADVQRLYGAHFQGLAPRVESHIDATRTHQALWIIEAVK